MAEVYLRSESGEEIVDLPLVCMKCGEPATVRKSKLFFCIGPTSFVAEFLSLFPGLDLLVAIVLLKRQRVQTPFCERHESYWWRFPALQWLFLFAMVGFDLFAALETASALRSANAEPEIIQPISAIVGFTLAVPQLVIVLVLLIKNRRIHPMKITKRYIRLTEVSPEFADAVEKLQATQSETEMR